MSKNTIVGALIAVFLGFCVVAQESCDQLRDRCLEDVRNGIADSRQMITKWYKSGLEWCESKYQACLQSPIRLIPLACRATWRWGCKATMRVFKSILTALLLTERMVSEPSCWHAYRECMDARGSGSL